MKKDRKRGQQQDVHKEEVKNGKRTIKSLARDLSRVGKEKNIFLNLKLSRYDKKKIKIKEGGVKWEYSKIRNMWERVKSNQLE